MLTTNHPDPLKILASTQWLVEESKYVKIRHNAIGGLVSLLSERISVHSSDYVEALQLTGSYEDDIQMMFVQSVVNFCFYAGKLEKKWSVAWPEGQRTKGGFYSLIGSFRRAIAENKPILDAHYLAELKITEAEEIFRGVDDTVIPLLKERVECLREAGRILTEKFNGKFIHLIEQADWDAVRIIELVIQNFPHFFDVVVLDKKEARFFKRAQLIASDLSHVLQRHNRILSRVDQIVTLADYRLPQMLEHFGVISYTPELEGRIIAHDEIATGSREEAEIRAATVWAIELLRQRMPTHTTSEIDNTLWLMAQPLRGILKPHHDTRTIFY